jgi:RNA polymerase sigma-70 factor (ECF subfamily)
MSSPDQAPATTDRHPEQPGCSEEDYALLQRAIAGDHDAWEAFHRHYHRLVSATVSRVLRRYLGSYTEADLADFTADVWVALLSDDRRRLRLYEPARCRLATWLKLLATNCTIDQLRVSGHHNHNRADDEVLAYIVDDQQPSPEALIERQQRADMVTAALWQLKAKDRNFVLTCLNETQPTKELARRLGISIHTIHSRKFKLRQKIARIVRRIQRDHRFLAA